jgi:dephospho-CoA kinase
MKNKKIAITGGIGSGKSLALRYMNEMGYPTFSCD